MKTLNPMAMIIASIRQAMLRWSLPILMFGVLFLGFAEGLQAQFIRQYGSATVDEIGKVLLPERDPLNNLTGNIFIGGNRGGKTLIMLVNEYGQILNQWSFKASLPTETEELADLRYDRTMGSLIGCGYIPYGNIFRPYAFRFNLGTGTVSWVNRFTTRGAALNLIDRGAITIGGTPYIHMFGMSYINGVYSSNYVEMNLITGALVAGSDKIYIASGSLSEHTGTEYDASTGSFISTGRWGYTPQFETFRPNIFRSDGNGTLVYNRTHLLGPGDFARLYSVDIVLDGSVPTILTSGDFNGTSATHTNFAISRHDPFTGAIDWAMKFDISPNIGTGEWATAILINSVGNYVVYGYTTVALQGDAQQLFLMEISQSGNILWKRTYPSSSPNSVLHNSNNELIELNGSYYLLSVVMNAGLRDIQLIRTDLGGELSPCAADPISVITSPLSMSQAMPTTLGGINLGAVRNPATTVDNVTSSVSCPVILDATGIELTATIEGEDIILKWNTDEPYLHGFNLLAGKGMPNMRLDTNLNAKQRRYVYHGQGATTYYFQIEGIRRDGSSLQSMREEITIGSASFIRFVHNRVTSGDLAKVQIQGKTHETVHLQLYDLNGRSLRAYDMTLDDAGQGSFEVITTGLVRGIYLLTGNGPVQQLLIL